MSVRYLKRGMTGNDIREHQKWFYYHGFYKWIDNRKHRSWDERINGRFDWYTEQAVIRFQRWTLTNDNGRIGAETRSTMNNWGNWRIRMARRAWDEARRFHTVKTWPKLAAHYSVTADREILSPARLCAMHQARGWRKGGYHALVQYTGRIDWGDEFPQYLRKSNEIGAHIRGHNRSTFGVCWIGRTAPTLKARVSLEAAFQRLLLDGNGKEGLFGHGELAATLCPGGLDMDELRSVV